MKSDRLIYVIAAVFALMLLAACSDDDPESSPTATPRTEATRTTPIAEDSETAVVRETPAGSVEVRGVVGAVNEATNTIEIRPTGGGEYDMIEVDASTEIRRAAGERASLSEIRPSDRIIAVGAPGDAADTLIANEITIQQVAPGGPQPGG